MSSHISVWRSRTPGGLRWLTAVTLAGVAAAAVTAGAALAAGSSGTVTETINVGVRSLTVSPTTATMCSSNSPLSFPNGACVSPNITITNGPAGGHVEVNGASALPSDGSGNGWALCGSPGNNCTGTPASLPGADQYLEYTNSTQGGGALSTTPACDLAFDGAGAPGCLSTPGQITAEQIVLEGPSSSSDQSTTFSTAVTWTAAP